MTKLKNITFATEDNIAYYSILKKSCKKNNIDLIVLGLGKKWEGFTMRFYEYYNYLQKLDSNEIVMINDAYDVIILENSEIIVNRFKNMNISILFGNHSGILELLSGGSWNNLSCGSVIGYAGYLKNMFKTIIDYKHLWEKFNNDDQIIINYLYKNNILKDIHLDTDNKVFFIVSTDNRHFNLSYLTQGKISGLEMKNGKIYNNNHTVCVFHLPGNMNGNLYLNYIGYDTSNVKLKIKGYRFTQIYGLFKNYLIIIIILILLYIIYRLRK